MFIPTGVAPGSWKPCCSFWLLVPAVVSQAGHHSLSSFSSPPPGAASGQDFVEVLLNSSRVLHRCHYGPAEGVRAESVWLWQIMAFTPISSLLPGSLWGKVSACENKTG